MIEIYKSSVKNVRELKSSRKQLKRLINQSIKDNKKSIIPILTKNYALLYSSFAETCFLKMIHTPYGFDNDRVNQILSQRNLENQWDKCLELALHSIKNNESQFHTKYQTLTRLIDKYIIKPSQLRNKIAHGQWAVALNSTNSSVNNETTEKIQSLDFVKVDIMFDLYEKIGQVVEDLIESPHKTHFRDFYLHLSELEDLVKKTQNWSIESKTELLTKKVEKQKQSQATTMAINNAG